MISQTETEILIARAKKLSMPTDFGDFNEVSGLLAVQFELSRQQYALPLKHVFEVIEVKKWISVPGSPPYMPGVIAHRAELLPIVDLRKLFEIDSAGLADLRFGLLIGIETGEICILADKLQQTIEFDPTTLQAPPDWLPDATCHGLAANSIVILDGRGLLMYEKLEPQS